MADAVSLDALVVAAHPDDAEITCGGLILKLVHEGRQVGVLDLSRGEMGTHGDENDRASEAAAAATVMGLAYRVNADMPDADIEYNRVNKLKIAGVIRDTRPELVILPHWEQRHPDHLACSRLGYDACFLAGLEKLDLDGDPHRPRKIIYASYYRNSDYSFLVDISDHFESKLRAIAAYTSQFGDPSWVDGFVDESSTGTIPGRTGTIPVAATRKDIFAPGVSIYDLLYSRSRALGQQVGVTFAEAYTVREHLLVDDPQKMPVQSI
jgi:bacillithiol biosynthesis deacetylase BshB1